MSARGGDDVVLRVRGVAQRYGASLILDGIDLELPRASLTLLTGRSGSGKSTLFKLLAGLHRPTAGSIQLEGIELNSLDDEALAEVRLRRIGIVFQGFNLLPELTAHENVRLPLDLAGTPRHAADARASELLAVVGLTARGDARPNVLSGGEQQRVAIARAVSNSPALLLADEPTGSLDRNNADAAYSLFRDINHSLGTTVLIISHDDEARRWFPRQLALSEGRITASAQPDDAHATRPPPKPRA